MLAASFIVLLLGYQQSPPACADAPSCRAAAIEAQSRKDFEAFHDLAWMAYRKGRTGDAELMLLLARAQSLSGRPGDALVMLKRLDERGVPTDAATSEDFARVRALPEWSGETASASSTAALAPTSAAAATAGAPGSSSSAVMAGPPAASAMPVTPTPAASPPTSGRTAKPPRTAKGPVSAPPASSSATPPPVVTPPASVAATPLGPTGVSPAVPPSVPSSTSPVTAPPKATGSMAPVEPAGKPAAAAKRDPREPLTFATVLTPTALAYDAVSRRFIIADRSARRIAVIDESTGQVATLVGAQGALGDIGGIAIDPVHGDLWVVASEGEGLALHRMQLISGRVLSSSSLKGMTGGVVGLAFARSVGLVLADGAGTVWRIRANGRLDKLAALEYVPRALATDADGRLYIAGGGQRLGRFALEPSMRKIDVVELAAGLPPDAPFAVLGGRLGVVVPSEGGYEIRTVPLRRR